MTETKHPAKFTFLYLLSLASLVLTAIGVGMVVFELINKYIPDFLAYSYQGSFNDSQLKFAFSALLISAPIYFLCSYFLEKNVRKENLSLSNSLRKWLLYLITFVSSVVIMGWLIGLLINFLGGELTLKFALKALSAIVISGLILGFYVYEIRRKTAKITPLVVKVYTIIFVVIVSSSLVLSLFLMESPQTARNKRLDEIILNSFDTISMAVDDYYYSEKSLPESLTDLDSEFLVEEQIHDPQTKEIFGYNIIDEGAYELCANFRTETLDNNKGFKVNYQRSHHKGWQCLQREIVNRPLETQVFK